MPAATQKVRIGDTRIDFAADTSTRGDETVRFTSMELSALRYLVERRGEVVSREELLLDVWGYSEDVVTRTIDRHMASIRKKIEDDPGNPRHIQTVYGVGYRLQE